MMEEEKRGSPYSLAAVACGVAWLMAFELLLLRYTPPLGRAASGISRAGAMVSLAGIMLGPAGIICGVVGYRRRERMRHWGWVGIVSGLLCLTLMVAMALIGVMLREGFAAGAGMLVGLLLVGLLVGIRAAVVGGERMMEEKKEKRNWCSWGAVGCGVLCLVVFRFWVWDMVKWDADGGLVLSAAGVLGLAGIICAVVGYVRRERMRHWGSVGVVAGLWLVCSCVMAFVLGVMR